MNLFRHVFNLLVLLSGLIFCSETFSNTIKSVFKDTSPLPLSAQGELLKQLSFQCSKIVSSYGLEELKTDRENDFQHDKLNSYEYTTQFVSSYYGDGMHPSRENILAKTRVTFDPSGRELVTIVTITAPWGCN